MGAAVVEVLITENPSPISMANALQIELEMKASTIGIGHLAYLERRKAVSVKATWGRNKQNNASLIIYDIARLQPPLDTFQWLS